jgi:Raf kinase inhibitor-like YbhB/YbcL family protein
MQKTRRVFLSTIAVLSLAALGSAQAPPAGAGRGAGGGGGRGGGRGPVGPSFSGTTEAWPDGGEVPMKYSFYGENKNPAFDFHWSMGVNPGTAPDTLKTYAIIFHDTENSTAKTTADTLHWSAFNIPGTASGIPEGLGPGDLPDGTRNGPGIAGSRPGGTPAYFGPGAGAGPIHHYLFEFYALDTKLDVPANCTREDLLKAMDGHVIGKAAYYGRFHNMNPPAAPGRGR